MAEKYASDLKALTALRFWAALWVVVFHFQGYFGLMGQIPLMQKGYLAVDFFFILSGFVLAHVYREQVADGSYRHSAFILKRIARIYPMHIAMLAAFVALVVAVQLAGMAMPHPERYDFAKIPQQIFLVHAWFGPGEEFNGPSWSISAEFFAYLIFPLVMLLTRWPRAMLVIGLAGTFGRHLLYGAPNDTLGGIIFDSQVLRIVPEFVLGVALREVLGQRSPPLLRPRWMTAATSAVLIVLAAFRAPDWVIIASTIPLIAAAAERSRTGAEGVLEHKTSQWLGEISYALYMVHVFVALVWFFAVERVVGPPVIGSPVTIAAGLLGFIIVIAAAHVCNAVIERPGRKLISKLGRWLPKSRMRAAEARSGDAVPP